MDAIMTTEIDLTSLAISPEFRQVLGRALAGERDKRFLNAADMRDALAKTPELGSARRGDGTHDEIQPKTQITMTAPAPDGQ